MEISVPFYIGAEYVVQTIHSWRATKQITMHTTNKKCGLPLLLDLRTQSRRFQPVAQICWNDSGHTQWPLPNRKSGRICTASDFVSAQQGSLAAPTFFEVTHNDESFSLSVRASTVSEQDFLWNWGLLNRSEGRPPLQLDNMWHQHFFLQFSCTCKFLKLLQILLETVEKCLHKYLTDANEHYMITEHVFCSSCPINQQQCIDHAYEQAAIKLCVSVR